jgi:hypothetical protein
MGSVGLQLFQGAMVRSLLTEGLGMKKTGVAFITVLTILVGAAWARADFRADLVEMKSPVEVVAVSTTLTAVLQTDEEAFGDRFCVEYIALCRKYGPVQVLSGDRWIDIVFDKRRTYIHPTEKKRVSLFGEGGKYYYRVPGRFELIRYQTRGNPPAVNGFIIRHDVPQLYLYKIKGITEFPKEGLPEQGDLRAQKPFLTKIGSRNVVFQYFLSLDRQFEGKHRWVVKKEETYEEVDDLEAFRYVHTFGLKDLYFEHSGPVNFLIRSSNPGKVSLQMFRNRTLAEQGIAYRPLGAK